MPDISGSPALIYAAIVVGVVVMIATAAPKILGPAAEAWSTFMDARRRTGAQVEDGLRRQSDYWRGVADERGAELERRDAAAWKHMGWDRAMVAAHGTDTAGAPPPVLPVTPATAPEPSQEAT